MFIAGLLCAVSICLPYTVVPMRRAMGLATYQWDNDPATHPVRARTARAGWGRLRGFGMGGPRRRRARHFFYAHALRPHLRARSLTPPPPPLLRSLPPPPPALHLLLQLLNFHGGANYRTHEFNDAQKLAAWSKHQEYRCGLLARRERARPPPAAWPLPAFPGAR